MCSYIKNFAHVVI